MNVNAIYYALVMANGGNPTAFFNALEGVAGRLGINFDWLCNVIYIESGFKPTAKNPISTASGLIQMLENNCRAFAGMSASEFRKLNNIQQLKGVEGYLKAQIRSFGKPKDWIDTYCLVFQPVWVGKSDTAVLSKSGSESNAYIDLNKNGVVTKGEFRIWANRRLPVNVKTQEVKKLSPI
jgi:hypothetical protein